jgi:hypothetical protein
MKPLSPDTLMGHTNAHKAQRFALNGVNRSLAMYFLCLFVAKT